MAHQIPIGKKNNKNIGKLNEKEKALLSLILMNKGKIKGTKLKRIYLEKYSLWDLQNTQEKLFEKGFLVKSEELAPVYLSNTYLLLAIGVSYRLLMLI